mgnify:CR=1 FL=1
MPTATSAPTSRWACRCGPTCRPTFQARWPACWSGLERCETAYLVTVPCDTPNFPLDLVERLAQALVDAGRRDRDGSHARRWRDRGAAGVLPAEGHAAGKPGEVPARRASARSTAGRARTAWRPSCSTTLQHSTTPTPSKSCSACSGEQRLSRAARAPRCAAAISRGAARSGCRQAPRLPAGRLAPTAARHRARSRPSPAHRPRCWPARAMRTSAR